MPVTDSHHESGNIARTRYLIILLLVIATLAVFWRGGSNDFVNYDDPRYVTGNPHVRTGLTPGNVRWAFTATEMGNWHPVTWVSHMADCQLYGLNPRGHHFTSIFLHAASTVLLFLLLSFMTGALWRSAFVAALFALHPLHVESVAWVAERKDVLSAFFFMITLLAYARYVQRPGPARYLAVTFAFVLGLMSKPMLVTLPAILLLLDFWPLGRYRVKPAASDTPGHPAAGKLPISRLVLEKVPLFMLAVISGVVTIYAQKSGNALASMETLPVASRVSNALVAYAGYMVKMVWPSKLAVLYPLLVKVPVWQLSCAFLLLGAISVAVFMAARRRPFLLVGWLWFLASLVPVIGLVQVGIQAMADRYTYIPLIGLFIMLAWGVPDRVAGWRHQRTVIAVSAAVIVLVFSAATWRQLGYWKNSLVLLTHALNVTSDNYMAHLNLGIALGEKGDLEEAESHFRESLRIRPEFAMAQYNLGNALLLQGKTDEAVSHLVEALKKNPDYAYAHYKLGAVLASRGKTAEAISHYSDAVRVDPDFAKAHSNLGVALAREGRFAEAINHYTEALRLDPNDTDTRGYLESAVNKAREAR